MERLRSFFRMSLLMVCFSTFPAGVPSCGTIHGCDGAPGSSASDPHSNCDAFGPQNHVCGFNGSACCVAWLCSALASSMVNGSFGDSRYTKRAPRGSRTVKYHTSVVAKCDMA